MMESYKSYMTHVINNTMHTTSSPFVTMVCDVLPNTKDELEQWFQDDEDCALKYIDAPPPHRGEIMLVVFPSQTRARDQLLSILM